MEGEGRVKEENDSDKVERRGGQTAPGECARACVCDQYLALYLRR